jgi:hypothetical protein
MCLIHSVCLVDLSVVKISVFSCFFSSLPKRVFLKYIYISYHYNYIHHIVGTVSVTIWVHVHTSPSCFSCQDCHSQNPLSWRCQRIAFWAAKSWTVKAQKNDTRVDIYMSIIYVNICNIIKIDGY